MRRHWPAAGWTAAVCLWVAYAAFGAAFLSPWAAGWDEVDFVLALDRFDLLAMQPHAPGYPYFIFGGMLIRLLNHDPVQALGCWNLLLTCSSAWPAYRLARRWVSPGSACLAAILVLTLPLNWTLAVRPMSEGAALALLWWYLWALVRLMERPSGGRWLTAVFLFGLLMGTRLSYAPFGIGLLMVWAAVWRDTRLPIGRRAGRALYWALSAIVFQLIWIGAVAAAEGGLAGTLRLFLGFGEGHFTRWGGGVAPSTGLSFAERLAVFISDNWLWTGTFARFAPAAALAALLLGLAVWRLWKEKDPGITVPGGLRRFLASPAGMLTVCIAAYAVWALFGQNIAKPRHAAPLAALTLFGLAIAALRTRPAAFLATGTKSIRRAAPLAAALAVLLAAAQIFEGASLVRLQHDERPAVYQLAGRLSEEPSPSTVVYTWEEERVLRYLNVPVQTRPIFTYDYFLANVQAESRSRILLTGSVRDEFRRQANPPDSKVRLLAEFRSDPRLDPVYGNIRLYEWKR